MKKYLIEVEATTVFTRTYEVEAKDEWAALEAYQAGADEAIWVRDSLEDDMDCDENGDTICVYADDGNMTLLIDLADSLDDEEDGLPPDADMMIPQEEN